jgi:hypothetical protein
MAITDDYIETQVNMTVVQLSKKLGIPVYLVAEKRAQIRKKQETKLYKYKELDPFGQEYEALAYFIHERKSGVLVEIAKDRLRALERELKLNYSPLTNPIMFKPTNNLVSACCNKTALFDQEDQVFRCNACHDPCLTHYEAEPLPDEYYITKAKEEIEYERSKIA